MSVFSSWNPLSWLSRDVFPFWLETGVDRGNGGFFENVSMQGALLPGQRRCMVQARQVFSLSTAIRLGVCDRERALSILRGAGDFFLSRYPLPGGAFRHSVTDAGAPLSDVPDLYGQAFALFGLAELHRCFGGSRYRAAAHALLDYLERERSCPAGGFTELEEGAPVYRSNPHMHLLEAALAWVEIDAGEGRWRELAGALVRLCREKFVDPESGALAESFSSGWSRELVEGRYLYEPGHLCEWSWLLWRYGKLCGEDFRALRFRLFERSEASGLCRESGALVDQLWSDHQPRKTSARFWPQCERIKAAARLERWREADAAMAVLGRYLRAPGPGLWYDTLGSDGRFLDQPVKASSLYHIIGAIAEYLEAPRYGR